MDWLDCHPARLGTAETPRQSSVVLSGPRWAPSNAVLLSLVQPLYWITFYFFCIHAVRLKINYLEQGHSIWGPPRTVSLVPDAAVILCFLRARQEQDKGWLGFSIASFHSPSFSGVWKYLQPPLWEQAYLQHAYLQECATHPSYLGDSPLSLLAHQITDWLRLVRDLWRSPLLHASHCRFWDADRTPSCM